MQTSSSDISGTTTQQQQQVQQDRIFVPVATKGKLPTSTLPMLAPSSPLSLKHLTDKAVEAVAQRKAASQALATTRLRGSSKIICQTVFLRTITQPDAANKEVSDLFEFHRPRAKKDKRLNASTSLNLSTKQCDILYALAGCSDVTSVLGKVQGKVRAVITELYGVDKANITTWFKNRSLKRKFSPPKVGSPDAERSFSDVSSSKSSAVVGNQMTGEAMPCLFPTSYSHMYPSSCPVPNMPGPSTMAPLTFLLPVPSTGGVQMATPLLLPSQQPQHQPENLYWVIHAYPCSTPCA